MTRYQLAPVAVVALICLATVPRLDAQAPAPTPPVAAPAPAPPAPAPAPAAPVAAPAPAPQPRPNPSSQVTATPLQVQLVISRYQGEKKISSVPYTIAVNADRPVGPNARMRMGVQIAVPQTVFTPAGADGKGQEKVFSPLASFSYKDIGTSIDIRATPSDDGRFTLAISVEDSSVYADPSEGPAPRVANVPVVRTFSTSSSMLLRDGQTVQFTVASDKINGEVMRIDVTLRVVK